VSDDLRLFQEFLAFKRAQEFQALRYGRLRGEEAREEMRRLLEPTPAPERMPPKKAFPSSQVRKNRTG
jgi:hypothetical protein